MHLFVAKILQKPQYAFTCTVFASDYLISILHYLIERGTLGDVPPLADPEGSDFLYQQPYMLRGLRDPATLTKAAGPSGAKVCINISMYI